MIAELPNIHIWIQSTGCILNQLPNSGAIIADNLSTRIQMTDLLGWREMNNVHLIRKGDNFVHIWEKTIKKHIHTRHSYRSNIKRIKYDR